MSARSEIAPEGAIWICGACGKVRRDRYQFSDASCFVNACLVKDDKPEAVSVFEHNWTAVEAEG